ncbi:4'-phosphopantetheinyl transferase superfamily protein [Pseudorhodobacter turbinis]|uniref:Enterobactin synthase component D n=1 Tax=Pseudorhodobacter turbinis TaxID=2500533 RepID=A0A4V1E0X2_9RHOB|nr:4'-phosphopantetheinyl transferase superfamily protein [Pseudorhodobacter turbinis]QCO56124.1 4'-phosphopantetheinyl transferase superfamily protein [Pseudorhodobacter turbinis]
MIDLESLLAAARAIAPQGVVIAASDPRAPSPPLWRGEILAGSVPKRLMEFAAGRAAARAAMAAFGPACAIPMGSDRAPIWPDGISGSITHSATACLAAVTRAPTLIGIDLEPATPLEADLWDIVLSPPERATLGTGLHAKLIFSAKEAAYKAQYARSRTLLEFDALEITLGHGQFTARFTQDVPHFPQNTLLHGRFCQSEGHFLTLVAA